MDKIKEIFANFWAIGIFDVQNQYIDKLIVQQPTQKQKELGDANQARNKYITKFTLQYKEEILPVCKKAFNNILGIDASRVERLNKKRTATGTLLPDQRGRKGNHNAISPERRETVHIHIATIPVRSSHYTRKINKHVQYIDHPNKVPVTDLYDKYKEFMFYNYPNIKPVKLGYYRTIFDTCYYIKSVKPKVDVCDFCENMDRRIRGQGK